jgi:tRNA(Ile)-lysidine synthase
MLEKVRETIKKHSMFDQGEVVAVAVSGGLDSTVLLHALFLLKEDLGVKLVVCHLNHGLRGEESKRDYSFVEALALKFALPFEGAELPAGLLKGSSTQAAAREARYAFLADTARRRGASKIALGHTLDDHAETVLMRFVKGSGTGGLKGIAPVRQKFVRPLIEVTREEVGRYAKAHSPPIEYVEDSSNASDKYLRNALRHDLIPHIKERYNPNIINTLTRSALISARDDEYLNLRAESAYADALSADGPLGSSALVFDRGKLLKLHPAVSTRVFLKGASILGKRARLYACHINRFLDLIKGSRPNVRAMLPGGLALVREYDRITLSTAPLRTPATFDMAIAVPGTTGVEEAGFVVSATIAEPPSAKALGAAPMTAFFDYDAIPGDVSIRNLKPGDTMVPMGMRGHKKLKDIFIDSKVPALKRARTPVLYAGGRIIWAVGLRQSDSYKVLKSTSRVLKIECNPG